MEVLNFTNYQNISVFAVFTQNVAGFGQNPPRLRPVFINRHRLRPHQVAAGVDGEEDEEQEGEAPERGAAVAEEG